MIGNRVLKWAAAAALAVASVPAIGFGRSHASLPLAAVTSTPTGLAVDAAVVPVKVAAKSPAKKVTAKKRTARSRRTVRRTRARSRAKSRKATHTTKHRVQRHRPTKHA